MWIENACMVVGKEVGNMYVGIDVSEDNVEAGVNVCENIKWKEEEIRMMKNKNRE